MKKQKVWFLTQQNLGEKVETFDVWDTDPRKYRNWNPKWKVFVMKEIKKGPKGKKESGQ